MTWTKKHDEFCLKQKLRPSTCVLLRYILRRTNKTEISEIEIDLSTFNIWVAKTRGRGYDRKTIKSALAQLDECTNGLILIGKTYTWAIHKLIVRPLSFVLAQNSPTEDRIPKPTTGNPMFDAQHKKLRNQQQQQDISKLDTLFTKIGLRFDRNAISRIWKLSGRKLSTIKSSIELLLHRHSTQEEPLKNPQGWLIQCLRQGWGEGFNLYYQAELPYFNSGSAIETFVADAIGRPPKPA